MTDERVNGWSRGGVEQNLVSMVFRKTPAVALGDCIIQTKQNNIVLFYTKWVCSEPSQSPRGITRQFEKKRRLRSTVASRGGELRNDEEAVKNCT